MDGLSLSGDRFFYGNPLASAVGSISAENGLVLPVARQILHGWLLHWVIIFMQKQIMLFM